jgi:hypothetical protein
VGLLEEDCFRLVEEPVPEPSKEGAFVVRNLVHSMARATEAVANLWPWVEMRHAESRARRVLSAGSSWGRIEASSSSASRTTDPPERSALPSA